MAINIRKVGEVADGSVTAAKLATGAVDLSTDKVTGELPESKLANNAVTQSKIAALAIQTSHLQDNVVTLAKAADDVKISHFAGDESEVSVTGTTETERKTYSFPIKAGAYNPQQIRVIASMKTNDVSYTATLNVYIDAEGSPRVTLTSTSTTYELQSDEADISDLTSGQHAVHVNLVSDDASGIAYNELFEGLFVKG